MTFLWLGKNKNVGEVASLSQYRREREEGLRVTETEKLAAKIELEENTVLPVSIYRRRVERTQADFTRFEQECWNRHLARVDGLRKQDD